MDSERQIENTILNPWLVEFADVEPMDTESQLYSQS